MLRPDLVPQISDNDEDIENRLKWPYTGHPHRRSQFLLEFQHIIQINDPSQLAASDVPLTSLWEGLVFRAKCPGYFNPALSSKVEHLSDSQFLRHLHFGESVLTDIVTLVEHQHIHTITREGEQTMFAESKTVIEAPAPGHLIVRFEYRRDSANVAGEMEVDEYIKQAYVQNDIDAVRVLRKLISTGMPNIDTHIQ